MTQETETNPQTARPRLHLRVEGVGKEAYQAMLWYFKLSAAIAWPGTLRVSGKRVNKRSPWAAEYAGLYSQNYFDLLSGGTNEWKVSLISPPAPPEESTS